MAAVSVLGMVCGAPTAGMAATAEQLCPPRKTAPRVILDLSYGEPRLDHTRSQAEIAALNSDSPALEGKWRRIGLTQSVFSTTSQAQMRVFSPPGRRELCVYVDSVTMTLGFSRLHVYVPTEYREGSCAYREVVDHEFEHVEALRTVLKRNERRFEAVLLRAMDRLSPFLAKSKTEARRHVTEAVNDAIRPVLQRFTTEQRTVNGNMDTADSYRAIQRRCTDW